MSKTVIRTVIIAITNRSGFRRHMRAVLRVNPQAIAKLIWSRVKGASPDWLETFFNQYT